MGLSYSDILKIQNALLPQLKDWKERDANFQKATEVVKKFAFEVLNEAERELYDRWPNRIRVQNRLHLSYLVSDAPNLFFRGRPNEKEERELFRAWNKKDWHETWTKTLCLGDELNLPLFLESDSEQGYLKGLQWLKNGWPELWKEFRDAVLDLVLSEIKVQNYEHDLGLILHKGMSLTTLKLKFPEAYKILKS